MIERLCGTIIASSDRTVTVLAGAVGYAVAVADPARFSLNSTLTVYIHEHWSPEKGSGLYGFSDELSRQLFCLIISCSKIGPSIALALLRQREVADIVSDIVAGNVAGLSSCQGIGAKKAELIIHELKDKVGVLAGAPALSNSSGGHLQQVHDALLSLSYSKQETARAVQHVAHLYKDAGSTIEINVLLRKALAFLSVPRD